MAAQIGAPGAAVRAHEELFAYWTALRRGNRLPARRDIAPAGFKRLLPAISLIDVLREPTLDYRIRLAGTGLYNAYGGEITGRRLNEVYSPAAADYWRAELAKVADGRPAVGVHNLAWRGAAHLSMVWLRLPLASNGTTVDMILGYDAVVGLGQLSSGIRAA
jgi:hypothetical protein